MNEPTVRQAAIRLLGAFQITADGKTITAEELHSSRMEKLLLYIFSHTEKECTASALTKTLWPDEDEADKYGALRTMVHRLRKYLTEALGEDSLEIVRVKGSGGYYYSYPGEVVVDAVQMEKLYTDSTLADNEQTEAALLRKCVNCYKGEFGEAYSEEYWVLTRQSYYRTLHERAVRRLSALLMKMKEYSETEELCRKASVMDPYQEDFHCLLMEALMAQGKNLEAQAHYMETVDALYDALGVDPSDELKLAYEKTLQQVKNREFALGQLRTDMGKEEYNKGTFFCGYEVFKKICELELRLQKRLGVSVYLGLLTVTVTQKAKADEAQVQLRARAMDDMKKVIYDSLRDSDIFTRVSANQYMILLQSCNYENAKLVMKRVIDAYQSLELRVKAQLKYSLTEQ